MPPEKSNNTTPAYLPYKTLLSSLENLAQGIPPKIDRSIWKNQPGTVQSQILSAYRFLGLIDEQTQPTPVLRALVENRSDPSEFLKAIIEKRYPDIVKHDLATMTTTMLNQEFEAAFGVDGDVKKKAIRFFLQAAKANGITLSKFLQDQTRVSTGPRKKRVAGVRREVDGVQAVDGGDELAEGETSKGKTKLISLRSGGQLSLSYSVDLFCLSTEDRDFVFSLIDALRGYEDKGSKHDAAAHGQKEKP